MIRRYEPICRHYHDVNVDAALIADVDVEPARLLPMSHYVITFMLLPRDARARHARQDIENRCWRMRRRRARKRGSGARDRGGAAA